ncbi:MAG: helix-turn-helix domain-containing protein [Brachybacterium sp.]|uniref:helix-turn-helix transcriptional regulator n=1 Tax=Brachybacterium sp. TaxID=1891286 RepID=UPI0026474C6C|nr:helix-turn-helix domain-containing protein [Brachybacterium sp.]MDN5687784.1 helix-turn-helix domain-containing protein [Brachybacterium sp.]
MPTELLTPPQVAQTLTVSTSTLSEWRYLRKGPAYVKQGRIVRYPADALAAWIADNTVTADA